MKKLLMCLGFLGLSSSVLLSADQPSSTAASNQAPATNFRVLQRYDVLISPKKLVTKVQAPQELTVHFLQESVWIDDTQKKSLESLVFASGAIVTIDGHADSSGLEWVNQRLSTQRAEAVRAVLAKKNPDARFVLKTWGSTRPLGDNRSEGGRRANRRVNITWHSGP